MIDYTLIRSGRKTIQIKIRDRDGSIEVRAPKALPQEAIDRFIASKEKWITKTHARMSERVKRRDSFTITYGSHILYRGKEYPVTEKDGEYAGFDGSSFYMPPNLTPEQVKRTCVGIYRDLAERYLTERTLKYAEKMSVRPATIKINNAKGRWGSCTSIGTINLAWRLIMADDDIIDYIIVHELGHMYDMSHSEEYWSLIVCVLHDYKERQKKLAVFQEKVLGENWD